MPRAANDNWPALAMAVNIPTGKSAHAIVAYDDEYSVTYHNQKLRTGGGGPKA